MPYFYYSFDAMMRPASMNDQSGASVVSAVDYGAANELKHMTYNGGIETAGSADFGVANANIGAYSNTYWVPGFSIIFNRQGSFFNGTDTIGLFSSYTSVLTIRMDSDRARVFMLIHEIGHLLGPAGFTNGDGTTDLQTANNDLIWEHGNKTFMSFDNKSGH
jgi:hypothetical protein